MALSLGTTEFVVGFLLALARTSAWVMVTPPFNSAAVPVRVRVAVAASLSFALAPAYELTPGALDLWPFLAAVVYQVFTGFALGFVVYLLFAVVQMAGELVDFQAGFGLAALYDPFTNATSTPVGRLYQLVTVTTLFAINGHLLIVRGFMASFQAAPLGGPRLGDLARFLTEDLARLLLSALQIAAPLLAALFLAEVVLGLVSRAAPQVNVLVVGFVAKTLLLFALMAFALPLVVGSIDGLAAHVVRAAGRLAGG